jgi:glycosyltransferase involved in cell wall biosynthesis
VLALSIITVAYNAEKTIADCIESVSTQTVEVEHILIDGASTDNTMKIVGDHQDTLSIIISEPDHGIYDAMNKGIALASGDVIGLLNADDYYPSQHVLTSVADTFSDQNVDACYGDLLYVDHNDGSKVIRYWRSGPYSPKKFFWGWMPPHPTFFAKHSIYAKYGLFNEELGSAADYEIMLRFLLKCGIAVSYIPETLVHMRTGGLSNASLLNRLKANRMDGMAWKVNGLRPYPWTIFAKPICKLGQWSIPRDL